MKTDTLYTHDLLSTCWSCGKFYPWEVLKDVCFDTMGFSVSLCTGDGTEDCYECVERSLEDYP